MRANARLLLLLPLRGKQVELMKPSRLQGASTSPPVVFDDLPVALFRTSPDGVFLAVNKAFKKLTGYLDDAVLNKLRTSDLYANADQRQEIMALMFNKGTINNYPLVVRRFDGSKLNAIFNVNLVRDADAKPLYLEGAIYEASEDEWSKHELQYRLALEAYAADLSAHLIGLAPENRPSEIIAAFGRLAILTGDERIHINLVDPTSQQIIDTYEWVQDGLVAFSETLPSDLYIEHLPWTMSTLSNNEVVQLADCLRDAPPDAAQDIQWWQEKNRKSSLLIPIFINNQMAGVFGFHNDTIIKTWAAEDIRVFQLIGEIILGVLLRIQAEMALNKRLKGEELALGLSTKFIEADPAQLIETIKDALLQVGKHGGSDFVQLIVYDFAGKTAAHSYKWRCDQPDDILNDLEILSFGSFSWAADRLANHDPLVMGKLSQLPSEAENEKAYLESEGIRSLMAVPINVREGYSGYLMIGTLFSEHAWKDWEIHLIRRLRDIFTRALAHEHTARALEESERRYRSLFEDSPVAMWEQDFTELKRHLDGLQREGVADFRTYFENHPEEAPRCMGMIRSVKFNRSVAELLYTKKIEDLEEIGMEELFMGSSSKGYVDELVAVAEGRRYYENEVTYPVINEKPKHIYFRWTLSADQAEPYRSVIVTGMDITRRMQLEEQTQRQLALETLVAQISAQLIEVEYKEIDDAIYRVLEEVGGFMGDDRVFLDLIDLPGWDKRSGYEWHRKGLLKYEGISHEWMQQFIWLQGKLNRMETVHIPSVATGLPPEAAVLKQKALSIGRKSLLYIPISMNNRFAGLFGCMAEFHEKAWSDEDIRMLRLVGEACISVLVRKQAEAALQRRIEAEELVTRISTRFIDLPLEEVDKQIEDSLVEVAKFMGCDRVFIDLLADNRLVYTHVYEWFTPDQQRFDLKSGQADLRNFPWMKNELENLTTINITSIANDLPPSAAAEQTMWLAEKRKSILLIPFSINNRVAGVLGCATIREENNWPQEDVNILQLASEIYASVLARKKAEQALRERDKILHRQVEELRVLNAVAAIGAAARDEQVLIEDISSLIIATLYPANFLVLLVDETSGLLGGRVFIQSGDEYERLEFREIPLEISLVSEVLAKRKPRRFADIRRSPLDPIVDSITRSLLCVPMVAGERNIGIINVESEAVGAFTEDDERFLGSLAGQLATAVTRVRFLNGEHSRRMEMEALVDFTQSLRNVETISEIENLVAEISLSIFDAEVAALLLPKGLHLVVTAVAGLPTELIGEQYSYAETSSSLWHTAQAGKLVYLDLNLPSERAAAPGFLESMGYAIIIPLKTANQVHGVLCLGLSGLMNADTSVERNLIDAVSDVAGNALYRAQVLETLEQRVRDRTQMLYIVYETVSILNKPIQLTEMIQSVLDGMVDVVKSASGIIHLIKDAAGTLELEAERNIPEEDLGSLKVIPLADQAWDWHQWLAYPQAPHVVTDLPVQVYFPEVLRLDGFLTYVGLPIYIQDEIVGFVSLYGHSAENIRPDALDLLRALSDQVAYAIEKDRFQKLLELNAVVKERQRLAGDLHDSVLQSLYSVTLMAKAAHTLSGNDQWERSRHYLVELGETMQKALKEMRLLIYELRPSALEEEGLDEALRQRLKAVEGRIGADTELVSTTQIDIPRQIEEGLYQIAVEALNNVTKHSQATFVSVQTSLRDGKVRMEIRDNGIGFERSSGVGMGIGLSIMAERARKVKGQLEVLSAPGDGTTIQVIVDL